MPEGSAYVVVGLGYGDEGKGTIVDYLANELQDIAKTNTVVRFSGGAQAGHNVVAAGGSHHCFSQFGAGTFVPGVRTFLSRYMTVDPITMYSEHGHLVELGIQDAFFRMEVDEACLVTTPVHKALNNLREEMRGSSIHGTTGMGVGETRVWWEKVGDDALFAHDLTSPTRLHRKMDMLNEYYVELARESGIVDEDDVDYVMGEMSAAAEVFISWAEMVAIESSDRLTQLSEEGTLIFEGSQGILLDEEHGFHPHNTWSRTGSINARLLLDEIDFMLPTTYIGVTRCYSTRHGAGPFPSYYEEYGADSYEDNTSSGRQGLFRVGAWDELATKYAVKTELSVDYLAITCFDQFGFVSEDEVDDEYDGEGWHTVESYEYFGTASDLHPYFDVRGRKTITSINPDFNYDHNAYQEAITNRLNESEGTVQTHRGCTIEYVSDHISETLDVPVLIRSYGKRADQKEWCASVRPEALGV